MPFIKFKDVNRSHAAKASISSSGVMSFNDGARRRFKMDENRFCVMYYDPEEQIIGLEFTQDENVEGAKNIRFRQTGADISAKAFLDYFEIDVPQTTLYELNKDKNNGWGVLELLSGKLRRQGQKFFEDDSVELP